MKISKNAVCPCNSGKKYKNCCFRWHKLGTAANALELMRSRYSAYALGNADYIIKTTHPGSPHYENDIKEWKQSIKNFANSDFKKLEIIEFIDGENEAFVEFKAYINDYVMHEKSRFIKEGKWYYVDGG
ncbi:MAG: hypothetical protein GXO62_02315 [Epsilonproteobacteria bacterium]|nr:hypothetical protein [Campylobacterota bacterium]